MDAEVTGMLTWLLWGTATIALLNLVAIVSLVFAYGWHHGLKPKLRRRRERRHAFERLLVQSSLDYHSGIPEQINAGEWWEW